MRSLELRVPPVLVVLFVGILMWLAARTWPTLVVRLPGAMVIAAVLVVIGTASIAAGVFGFRRAKTTVNPTTPDAATAVVTGGIYTRTRNPMYLGMVLVLLAWAVMLCSLLALLGPVGFVLYMNRFQIVPEERVLHQKFGAAYDTYRAQVRRWI